MAHMNYSTNGWVAQNMKPPPTLLRTVQASMSMCRMWVPRDSDIHHGHRRLHSWFLTLTYETLKHITYDFQVQLAMVTKNLSWISCSYEITQPSIHLSQASIICTYGPWGHRTVLCKHIRTLRTKGTRLRCSMVCITIHLDVPLMGTFWL